jgi:hypothetical protein
MPKVNLIPFAKYSTMNSAVWYMEYANGFHVNLVPFRE